MTLIPTLATMLLLAGALQPPRAGQLLTVPLDVHEFRVLGEEYDPENPRPPDPTYYRTIDGPGQSFVRGVYLPPRPTVTLFQRVPDELHHGVRRIQWRWRAQVLPSRGTNVRAAAGTRPRPSTSPGSEACADIR